MRSRIRKDDMVMIIAGRERGKTGKILRVIPSTGRALVERLNLVKRHSKPKGPQSAQGIVEKEAAIDLSNLMIMCDKCNAPVRMGKRELDDGRHVRVCRRCGDDLAG